MLGAKRQSYTFTSIEQSQEDDKPQTRSSIWKNILLAVVCFTLGAALVKYGMQQDTAYVEWKRAQSEAPVGYAADMEMDVGRGRRAAPRPPVVTKVAQKPKPVKTQTKKTVGKVVNKASDNAEERRENRSERRDNIIEKLPEGPLEIKKKAMVVDVFLDLGDEAVNQQADKVKETLSNIEVKPGVFVNFLKEFSIVKFTAETLEKIKDIAARIVGFAFSMSVKRTVNICAGHDCRDVWISDLGIASAWTWYGAVQAVKYEIDEVNKGQDPDVNNFCNVNELKETNQKCHNIAQTWTGAYYCSVDEDRQEMLSIAFALFELTKIFYNDKLFKPYDDNTKGTPGQVARMREVIIGYGVPCFEYDYAKANAAVVEHMAYSGFAAHRLAPEPADDSLMKVDFTVLDVLSVRKGFARLGACAFFDKATRKLKSIQYQDTFYTPSHPDWEWAMFAWRSSAFLTVTAIDHLAWLHYLMGQQGTTASREKLPPNHPLRRFLKPFTYGQTSVNHNAAYHLFPEWAALQRASSLTEEGLDLAVTLATMTFAIPQKEAEKEKFTAMTGEMNYPYGEDYLDAFTTVEAFVKNFFDLHYPTQAELDADHDFQEFWLKVSLDQVTNQVNYKRDFVENYIAQFIFHVTFIHQHVGTVADWTTAPHLGTWKLRKNEKMGDLAYLFQVNAISITTGLPMIKLMGFDMEKSELYKNLDHEAGLKQGWDQFQADLEALEETISARNAERGKENECLSFLPSRTGISISV